MTGTDLGLDAAPRRLVEQGIRAWGRFAGRPYRVNPLDAWTGAARAAKRLRLKEWLGFTLLHPEVSSSLILQDANYLASSEIYVRDAHGLVEYARDARGGSLRLPEVLDGGRARFAAPGYEIAYAWAPDPDGRHRITARVGEIAIDLTLHGAGATAPLSVSAPLPGGAMYTHKVVHPVSGTVSVAGRGYVFEPERDLAVLDEHKTFLPYRTRWTWGTFAGRVDGGIVGANLAERPTVPGTEDESCLWLDGRAEPLSRLTFAATDTDPMQPWRVSSADDRVRVRFTPEDRKTVRHRLGVASIDYWQAVGTYAGTVGGREIEGIRGVLESMRMRS